MKDSPNIPFRVFYIVTSKKSDLFKTIVKRLANKTFALQCVVFRVNLKQETMNIQPNIQKNVQRLTKYLPKDKKHVSSNVQI